MKWFTTLILLSMANHALAEKKTDLTLLDEMTSDKHVGLDSEPKSSAQIAIEGQNKVFSEANLEKEVAGFDQLDRDMLILMARREPLDKLSKKFPKISAEKLRVLKTLVQETKR